jgi:hypothetical protein
MGVVFEMFGRAMAMKQRRVIVAWRRGLVDFMLTYV